MELRKFIKTTIREYLNEQNESPFKVTQAQLNKINKKVKNKHPEINVGFTFYGKLQAKYTELTQNDMDDYYYRLWNSIIANSNNFDDVYYSI
jgi:hypothetical protein